MGGDVTIPAVFLAGIISFLSPCVLPLVPPYLCYLGGTTLDQLTGEGRIPAGLYSRVVGAAMLFVLGFTSVFVLLGASASAIGQLLVGHLDILAKIAGVVIIVMGLHFLGLFKLSFLFKDTRYAGAIAGGSMAGAYIMGAAFAFGWTPCIGPILAAILSVAAAEATVAKGAGLLAVYSAGLGIPFLLAAVMIEQFSSLFARMKRHLATVEKVMGVLMVFTGIGFLTGSVTAVSIWLLETFPALAKFG